MLAGFVVSDWLSLEANPRRTYLAPCNVSMRSESTDDEASKWLTNISHPEKKLDAISLRLLLTISDPRNTEMLI